MTNGGQALRLKPKPGDYFILVLVVAAALLMLVLTNHRETARSIAVIIQNGEIIRRIDLNEINTPMVFAYEGEYPGTIEAEKGRIRFLEADCPDKVCVRTGWISRNGQIAVCLPDNIMIKIEGSEAPTDNDTDIILR